MPAARAQHHFARAKANFRWHTRPWTAGWSGTTAAAGGRHANRGAAPRPQICNASATPVRVASPSDK